MVLQGLYLAKQELRDLLRDKEGYVGITIATLNDRDKSLGLKVLVRADDSPVIEHIPFFMGGLYRVVHEVVGDNYEVQELGLE